MAEHVLSTSYSFFSQALDGPYSTPGGGHGTLLVANIEGKEEVSTPYQFDLTLLSSDGDLDLEKILASPGWLQIRTLVPGEDQPRYNIFHGRLAFFEQTGHSAEGHLYTARLVPQVWKLKRTVQSRVFVEEAADKQSVEDLTKEILKAHGLEETTDYRFDLSTRTHAPKQDYTVQYEESDFDFLSRWLEHHGISYLFDQSGSNEVIVFTDKLDSFAEKSEILNYLGDVTEGTSATNLPGVFTISCRKNPVPKEVVLKDYKWDNPDLNLECTATVKATSEGTVYEYNNNYETTEEGNFLAALRSTELLARETLYSGTSNCVFSAGSRWELEGHPGSSFANKYLVLKVNHHGVQGFNLATLVQESGSYKNSFTCILSKVPFCPQRKTEWPTIQGVLRAKVVAPSDSIPDIDSVGKYKVQLSLDRENNSSNRIRMAQPYADSQNEQGMHFPLYKDTEVTLTHIGGNPDRPIIAGAVPSRVRSVVNSSDEDKTNPGDLGFRTANGVQIFGHDQKGDRWVQMKAGESETGVYVTESDFFGIVGVNTTVETIATRTKSWAHFSSETAAGYSINNASAVKFGVTSIPMITALNATNKFGISPLLSQWSSVVDTMGGLAISLGICSMIKKKVKSGAMEIPSPPDPTDEAAVEAFEVEISAQEEEAKSIADKAKWVKDKLVEGIRALPGVVAGASSAVAGAVAAGAYSKGGINMFSGGPSVLGGSIFTVQSEFPNMTPGKGDIQIGTQYGSVRIMGGTGNEENGTEIFGNSLVNIWSSNLVTLKGKCGKLILNNTHAYLSAGHKTQISASEKRIFLHQDECVIFLEKDDISASASKKITLRAEPTPVASPSDQCIIEMTNPGTMTHEAGKSLTLKGPGNTISLDDDGVALDHGIVNSIKITKDGEVEISASKIKIDATSAITIEGSDITLNAKGQLHLKGKKVYLGEQCMIG